MAKIGNRNFLSSKNPKIVQQSTKQIYCNLNCEYICLIRFYVTIFELFGENKFFILGKYFQFFEALFLFLFNQLNKSI